MCLDEEYASRTMARARFATAVVVPEGLPRMKTRIEPTSKIPSKTVEEVTKDGPDQRVRSDDIIFLRVAVACAPGR